MKDFLKKFKEDESGQSLIEILIALTIGVILIGAASTAVVTVLQSGSASEKQQTGAVLAQDYTEKSRAIAGSDWHSLDDLEKSSSTLYHFGISTSSAVIIFEGSEGVVSSDIREDIVGYWGLDEASSTTVYDKSSSGNNGTLTGTSASSNCKVGDCIEFTGGSDQIKLDNEIVLSKEGATLAWWAKPDSTADMGVFKDFSSSPYREIETKTNQIFAETDTNCNYFNFNNFTKDTNWTFYTIVFNNSRAYLYLDGNFISEADSYGTDGCSGSGAGSLISDFTLGRVGVGAYSNNYDGLIDDIRVYDRALSATEIDNMHNSSFFNRSFYVEDVCRTNDSNYEIAGTKPCDSGEVEDPSTVKITVLVTWESDDAEFIVEDYITRWRNRTFPQTDWSGGSGSDGPFTNPTNTYSTSTNISTSTGGIQIEGI